MCNIQNFTVSITKEKNVMEFTTSPDGRTTLDGVDGTFLQLLLHFLGLNTRFHLTEDYSNLSLNSSFGFVDKGSADMALDNIILDSFSFNEGSMSMPYKLSYVTFAVRKSVPLSTRYAFLHTYTLNTWLGFLAVFVAIPFIGVFILGNELSYIDVFFQMFSAFLRQGMKLPMVSLKNRIFILFFLFFTMVVSFGFSAVFFSFMVSPLKKPPVRNFKELYDGLVLNTQECYMLDSTFYKETFALSPFEYVRNSHKIIKEDHIVADYEINQPRYYEQILAQGNALIDDEEILDLRFGVNPEIFLSEDKIVPFWISIYFRKDFCLKDRINTFIARAWRAGLRQKIVNDFKMKKYIKSKKTISSNTPKPLTLYEISGVFLILIIGNTISMIVLVLEIVVNKVM